jgi:hypothetical protein
VKPPLLTKRPRVLTAFCSILPWRIEGQAPALFPPDLR